MGNKSIFREQCSNPFFFNGQEIHTICFYKDGKIIASTRWFGSNNLWERVDFPFEIRNARKVNLDKKDAFIAQYEDNTYHAYDKKKALYIHADLAGLEFVKVEDKGISMLSHHTCDIYKVSLSGEHAEYRYNDKKGVCERVCRDVADFEQKFDCNHRLETTEEGGKCEELSKRIKELTHINLSKYDIESLLKHFDIKEKKN